MAKRKWVSLQEAALWLVAEKNIPMAVAEEIVRRALLSGEIPVRGKRPGDSKAQNITKEVATALAAEDSLKSRH
jgi:hypothetical protein